MKPVEFQFQNVVYGKDQEEYQPLPAYKSPDGEVLTCWKMDWKERFKMLLSGRVYVSLLTFNNPLQPICLFAVNPLKEISDRVVKQPQTS